MSRFKRTIVKSFSIGLIVAGLTCPTTAAPQTPSSRPRTTTSDKPSTSTSTSAAKQKTSPAEAKSTTTSQLSASELIAQGKVHYRAARFSQARAKFEAALKVEPDNDEALGLAAITAFRLDNQEQSRAWFVRRAELPGQKPSVKAFSYYRVALSYWRGLHDAVAKSYTIKDGKITFKMKDADAAAVRENFLPGLDYADRALAVNANYAEAHNIKNLLYTEAALAASSEEEARRNRSLALESLKKALKLHSRAADAVDSENANFNFPTVRIGEIARNVDEEGKFRDEMGRLLHGGIPIKRVNPVFPSMRPPKKASDASQTGVTDKGGAYSIGSGRGALTAAYEPGTVKVEVLVSTSGDVVFAHVVSGRADLNGSAVLAARGWKFSPAKYEDAAVQLSGVITFDMRPGGARSSSSATARPTPTPTPRPPSNKP